jgi:hypothetical protein
MGFGYAPIDGIVEPYLEKTAWVIWGSASIEWREGAGKGLEAAKPLLSSMNCSDIGQREEGASQLTDIQ